MNSNLLMNCLWYEDIEPIELANTLELSPEKLFDKLFGNDKFTSEEIDKIVALLNLTAEECHMIFGKRGGNKSGN